MSTVKFAETEKLKQLQARLYLLTNQHLTQQEILEYAVNILTENIDLLVERLQAGSKTFTSEEIKKIQAKASHWGEDTKDLSSTIDETLYGKE
ncbi:MAG: hypothetical protein JSW11_13650 [Candidatus Heimdallarchaeota archaeon]|nr:MAG: hypothetical protein JSW11_13650 [Candidatus Heimdallarchaeota archaeon]